MKITAAFVLLTFTGFVSAHEINLTGSSGGFFNPKKPLVTSSELQKGIKSAKLLSHARKLQELSKLSNGTRSFGSRAHNATLSYFKKLLDDTKFYDTSYQTFLYLYSEGSATFSANGTAYDTAWFTYGAAGDVEAPIVPVNDVGCSSSDYPEVVRGKIALVKRGTCEFGLKVALAGAAGAAGSLVYNNAPGAIGGGTLGQVTRPEGPYVPGGSITGEAGEAILAAINGGSEIVGKIHVDAITEDRYSSNLFATTKVGDKQNIVVTGGHSDSVPAGPGINDDGSGSIGILEVALALPKFNINNSVRFAWWTAEEFGLVGSEYYITNLPEVERQKIAVYLNFDMIASPNYGYFIYDGDGNAFNISGPTGSEHVERVFEQFYAQNRVKSAPTEFNGRSDYGPFLDVNIPAGGVFTGAEGVKTTQQAEWWGGEAGVAYDKCYHQACDTIDNLNVPAFVLNTKAIAHAVATYARSLTGIPRPRPAGGEAKIAKLSYDERKHQACGHEAVFSA